MGKQVRQSNIELLRILSILGVILLHYNHPNIGGAMAVAAPGSINQFLVYFTESIAIGAVNLFILISGFFLSTNQKRNPWKIVWLLLQVMVFSAVIYLKEVLLGNTSFSWKILLEEIVPTNYFVILYGTLYFISPYLNLLTQKLDRRTFRNMLILFGLLFSICPTLIDLSGDVFNRSWNGLYTISSQGSGQGYTIVNFVLMYLLGSYLRGAEVKKLHNWVMLLVIFGNTCLLTLWSQLGMLVGLPTDRSGLAYCNPLIIINAVFTFQIFQNMQIKANPVINTLAKGVFTAFLLHVQFFQFLSIRTIAAGNPLVMLLHMLISCVFCYLACWCVHFVYAHITRPIFGWIEKKIPLPQLEIPLQ